MKKIKLFLSLMLSLASLALSAQDITVKGVVSESNGDPVPAAAVQVKGTTKGAITDANGNYSISVPSNGTLVFSSIGFETLEVAVNGKGVVNAVLKLDAEALSEAVVVGYGSAKKVGNIVGSVTTVKADIVKNAPSSSALDQLQGQVAGMLVLTSNGMVGDNTPSVTIHGTGSLGAGSTPLYVIDGVPSTSRTMEALNPNDIASITVLKDATATSIYGSRAANGVIYVTTRNGNFNSKATVTLRSQWGTSTLANEQFYKNMMSGDELVDFWTRAGIFSANDLAANYSKNDDGHYNNTQWYKYYMNLWTPQSQNDVTIEGGSDKVAYSLSLGQFHQTGSAIGNYLDKYTARASVQAHPKSWLTTGANVGLAWTNNRTNGYWGSNYLAGGLMFMYSPLDEALDEDGNEYEVKYPMGGTNQKSNIKHTYNDINRYMLNANIFAQIEPVKNLKIKSQVGTDTYYVVKAGHNDPSWAKTLGSTAYRSRSYEMVSNNTITNTIEYSFDIAGSHDISVLAGQEAILNSDDYFYAYSAGLTDDRLINLDNGTQNTFKVSETASQSRFLSFFGHADYSFEGRYIADVTVRNDACSRFGANYRNATFWAAGAKWNISKENFMKNVSWIKDLGLKVSYGTQGNASIGDYSSLGLVSSSINYGGSSSVHLGQPANPDLTWEKQALFSATVDGRLWNRLGFEFTFYNRVTSAMLMDVPYPYTSGFEEVTANVGSLQNTGVDISLNLDILKGKDYYLTFNTVFNYNGQKITELFQGRQTWIIANTGVGYNVGSPVCFYYPIYAGIDPADGQPMWYVPGDDTNVTTMDPNNTTKVFDEDALTQNTGIKRHAPMNGGFGLRGGWKGISFAMDFSYVLGKYLINNDRYFYTNPTNFAGYGTSRMVSDFWTPDNTDAKYPDWSSGATTQFDSSLLEDASFIRLKNLQIGYSFPTEKWGWKVVKGLKINFTGRNLLTGTKYTGMDPEVNSNLTLGNIGNSKQFLGGVELTF